MAAKTYDVEGALARLSADETIQFVNSKVDKFPVDSPEIQKELDALVVDIPSTYSIEKPPVAVVATIQKYKNMLQRKQAMLLYTQFKLNNLYSAGKAIIVRDAEIAPLAQPTKETLCQSLMPGIAKRLAAIEYLLMLCDIISRNLNAASGAITLQFEMVKSYNWNR